MIEKIIMSMVTPDRVKEVITAMHTDLAAVELKENEVFPFLYLKTDGVTGKFGKIILNNTGGISRAIDEKIITPENIAELIKHFTK